MTKILSKFGEQQLVMVNYACGFNLSDIYILLDVLLCSIAEYFYELCGILASP